MKISIYTFVKNGIYYDFHVENMLKHHLPLADEIIVNEGCSSDQTFERIKDIDPRIKIYRNNWNNKGVENWYVSFKEEARKLCTGDWCILLDCDEFIPEWEFDLIRKNLENAEYDIFAMNYLNFYGNYKVINFNPKKFKWPAVKYTIHRNLDNIEVWGDGSNVRKKGWLNINETSAVGKPFVNVHHFGFVREASRLREKWRIQTKINDNQNWKNYLPSFIYNLFPHKWDDPDFMDDLKVYGGPYVKAVIDNQDEFVRDNFRLYELLLNRP